MFTSQGFSLAISPAHYREILDATSDALLIHDRNGRILYVNGRACQMYGWTAEEFQSLSIGSISTNEPPYSTREAVDHVRRAIQEGYAVFEWLGKKRNGGLFWAEVALHSFEMAGEKRVIASVRDVTERRKAEEDRRASQEKLAAIFDNSTGCIAYTEPLTGKIVDVNAAWIRFFGVEKASAVGTSALALGCWHDPTERKQCMELLAKKGGVNGFKATMLTRGKPVPVLASVSRIELGHQPVLLWEIREISELTRAQKEQEALREQLLQAQKMESVGRLAGGVAHDFNNMLQAILGNAVLALMTLPEGSPVRENLEEIHKCATRSADLTRQLLAFARRQTASPVVLDLNETVEGMLKMIGRLIGEDIDLQWQPAEGLWEVKVDPSQVDQILANLCVNARDAIGGVGKITLWTRNEKLDGAACAAKPGVAPGDYVLLGVRDDGCGMDGEVKSHLFEPFYTTKETGKGTGLGLATVYGVVKQNLGFIEVSSEPSKGSTFEIYLPRYQGPASPEAGKGKESVPGRGKETLLFVEDEAAILLVGRRMLERLGYTVLAAGSPEEALNLVAGYAGRIHLLVTDVIMPGMNGKQLSGRLRELHPSLKCLFMSGYTSDVIANQGILELGVHFIQKPFSMADLGAKVRDALERNPAEAASGA